MPESIARSTARIADEIAASRVAAHRKHRDKSIESSYTSNRTFLAILVEEVGEAAHELTYDSTGDLRAELIDIATVAVAWIATLDRA